jgi:hypothetical protein
VGLGEEGAVMTATLGDVTPRKKKPEPSPEEQAAAELVRQAKERGLSLTGPDGLLKQLTKTVLETALNEEMTAHLGYEKNDPAGAGTGNVRNGSRAKTVLTEASGHVQLDVPRDRAGTFQPRSCAGGSVASAASTRSCSRCMLASSASAGAVLVVEVDPGRGDRRRWLPGKRVVSCLSSMRSRLARSIRGLSVDTALAL